MTKRTETGHATNVARFEELITLTNSLSTQYNPSRIDLQSPALETLATSARESLNAVNTALVAYNNLVAAREVKFASLGGLATRLLNAVKSTTTTEAIDDNVKALVHKIQGVKATPKLTETEKAALAADGKSTKEISSSQMSYNNRLENFNKLIQQLASIPEYTPNEPQLRVGGLNALYDEMKTLTVDVTTAERTLANARITRNEVLYKENTGVVEIAADVKTYLKSVFGSSAPQFKQASKLEFSSYKA